MQAAGSGSPALLLFCCLIPPRVTLALLYVCMAICYTGQGCMWTYAINLIDARMPVDVNVLMQQLTHALNNDGP